MKKRTADRQWNKGHGRKVVAEGNGLKKGE